MTRNWLFFFTVLCIMLIMPCSACGQKVFNADVFFERLNEGFRLTSLYKYDESLDVLDECWDMIENESLPKEDKAHLQICIFFLAGWNYTDLGEYKKAEWAYVSGIESGQLRGFEDDVVYRKLLSGISTLYTNLHNYDRAILYGLKAKQLCESNNDLGQNYVSCLYNLGIAKIKKEEYNHAEDFLNKAQEIAENQNDNISLLKILNGLSLLYNEMKDYKRSNQKALLVTEYCEKNNITDIAEYGLALNQLGLSCFNQKNFKQSEIYFVKAFSVLKAMLNADHYVFSTLMSNLAFIYTINQDERLLELSKIINNSVKQSVGSNFQFLTFKQRELYWQKLWKEFVYSYMLALNKPSQEANTMMYDNALFAKGLLMKSANKMQQAILASKDKILIQDYERLSALNELESKEENNFASDSLKAEMENVEKSIMLRLPEANANSITWKDVRSALANNEIAIEFIAFPLLDESMEFPIKYVALLTKKDSEYPFLIPLCLESEIDLLLARTGIGVRKDITELYSSDKGGRLYDNLWKPLEPHLRDIKTVYYSPCGRLNQIAFSAIPVANDRLINKYDLRLVSTTEDISAIKSRERATPSSAVVYGGISYDALTDSLIISSRQYNWGKEAHEVYLRGDDAERKGWEYLIGTASEADSVSAELNRRNIQTKKYHHHYGNEESFKSLSNTQTSIIHMATHGYFLTDSTQLAMNKFIQEQKRINTDRPESMFRNGLLLAGANRAWNGKNILSGIDDGILTADEIARMNLSGTKLVVLSACNTGLGHTSNVEGVYGLPRAFKLAGVDSIIMSLWSISDESTCSLMIEFYKNWLSGMDKSQALKQAQIKLCEKYPEPYYWAGFVLLD